ncbi:MEDS domain-containing protein [Streptomyces sp. NL15-2K]|uniref:MEDS domain-containing protein n=1 Tax=Streptomyces sp. NL15-2K TaxID=376149 RepID=UPI000F573B54|nr:MULTISPECIES: MEDS domain-containing protein [Actinomycetes]WKX12134.1 MEDS domain-containing protein [Kutzneria buriramensis]GCB46373.1 regulator of sigma factor [Streptomyces sp. NL15-2K]
MTHQPTPGTAPFDHRMTTLRTDDDFLSAALPFLTEALTTPAEPPPVAIAAPEKLTLLRDTLGTDAKNITLIPHTAWYTGSAANAIAQAAAHLATHAAPGGRIHLLMEPVWNGRPGRSPRETAEWIRYEALANLLFAPFATTALCVYDTRTAGSAVVEAARRTHPDTGVYEDPLRIAAELDAVPLPPPPADAHPLTHPDADAVGQQARARGLPPADAELFTESVTAAAADLAPITGIRFWGKAPACVCELRTARRVDDPLAGFVPPPTTELHPDQGLWFTRQVCAYVDIRDIHDIRDIRDGGEGSTVRIQYA